MKKLLIGIMLVASTSSYATSNSDEELSCHINNGVVIRKDGKNLHFTSARVKNPERGNHTNLIKIKMEKISNSWWSHEGYFESYLYMSTNEKHFEELKPEVTSDMGLADREEYKVVIHSKLLRAKNAEGFYENSLYIHVILLKKNAEGNFRAVMNQRLGAHRSTEVGYKSGGPEHLVRELRLNGLDGINSLLKANMPIVKKENISEEEDSKIQEAISNFVPDLEVSYLGVRCSIKN